MNIKLGISPINWCNDDDPNLGKDISFEQCIQEMAEAGYCGTELGNKYPRDPSQLKSSLTPLGLEISSAWFSTFFTEPDKYQLTLSNFLKQLSFLRALGARYVNVCECGHAIQNTAHAVLGNKRPIFTGREWENLIQGLHHIGRIAYDFDVQVVYHFHAGTGVFTQDEIDFLMNHTSPTLVSLLLDTGHAAVANINPMDLIQQHSTRIRYVHLKDIRKPILRRAIEQQWNFMDAVRAGIFTVPGDGDIDFSEVIKSLAKNQYQGWMLIEAEQDPAKAHPLQYAKKAYQYLTGLLGDYRA